MKGGGVIMVLAAGLAAGPVSGSEDPDKEEIGIIRTEVIFGTPSSGAALGLETLTEADQERLRQSRNIPDYDYYLRLGRDEGTVFRGYQNWTSPLAKSEAIMVAFQPQGRIGTSKLRLDLEFWQNKKLVLRTDPVLEEGRRVFILGPKWRDGRLIIMVELVDLQPE